MQQVTKKFMNWASILEDQTRDQVSMTSGMPFVHPHIALMPDAHLGKGCAVGTVLPTKGAIIPAAVGVDIGCGMIAVKTNYDLADIENLDRKVLRESIEKAIPLGPGQYNETYYDEFTRARANELADLAHNQGVRLGDYALNWDLQLGTLGGGNHFIEVSLDEDDNVWLFLHSGSRGIGNKMAQRFIKIAQDQCKKRFIDLPSPDLAYLVEGDTEFWEYIRHLRWAQHFALLNREEMMDRVMGCFKAWVGEEMGEVAELERINCHHNYTERERHYGADVWLSRKGAINARHGVMGLIPGSMGDKSYVVRGLGNRLSLNSAPHGAGRVLGRRKAEKAYSFEDLKSRMSAQGIEWRESAVFIDEIPDAYKNIDVVMEDAKDLVEIVHTLRQIVNVKGE